MSDPLHAVAIALGVDADGPLAGVLILGPSGSGKSSLALAAIESCPWRRTSLVADDAVLIDAAGVARAPEKIAGLIEVRGFGPAPVRSVAAAPLFVAVDLGGVSSRLPDLGEFQPQGAHTILPLCPFQWNGAEATAVARLRLLIRAILSGQSGRHIVEGPGSGRVTQ